MGSTSAAFLGLQRFVYALVFHKKKTVPEVPHEVGHRARGAPTGAVTR